MVQSQGDTDAAQPMSPTAHAADQLRRGRPFVTLAAGVIVGTALGIALPAAWAWLALALVPMAGTLWMIRRGEARAALRWGWLVVVPIAAGWAAVRTAYTTDGDITRYLSDTPQLASITGTVATEPRLRPPERGPFGGFTHTAPGTIFELEVDTITRRGARVPATGRLLVKIDEAEHRLSAGMRIAAEGWMSQLEGPSNPGEFDYRAMMARQGVHGRITLRTRGNWRALDGGAPPVFTQPIRALRRHVAHGARDALRLGMLGAQGEDARAEQRRRLALLEALLLGRWTDEAGDIHDSFRQVGLAHLMSISGAHLGILLGLVWLVVRAFVDRPPRAALVVLVVLGLYLLAVPLRLPIVRAAIMAGFVCAGFATGRRVSAMGMMALACVVLLVWRPMDLLSAGFQLSFGVVAALLLFAKPVARWTLPAPVVPVRHETVGSQAARLCVDYLAASTVAYLVALPLVAYHFGLVNPLAVLLSVLALPVVTVLLGLGYLKTLLGVCLPSASILMAGPLAWVTDTMLGLVEHAGRWPGAAVELARPVSAAWVVAMLATAVALLSGRFARRRWALLVCALVLTLWTFAQQRPGWMHAFTGADRPALRVNMFAVGDGSCYLLRSGGRAMMFDCGSQQYWDLGERSIVPALRRLNVRRLDVMVLSHADLDHYAGALDVIDAVTVGVVRVPPQLLRAAEREPGGAAGYLVEQLRRRGMRIAPTARGWSRTLGDVRIEALWPTPGFKAEKLREGLWRMNDTSLVLSVRAAGRRLLLTGDIAERATAALLRNDTNLRADIAELPHHGSFNELSTRWLDAVSPRIVLQSSGPARLRDDKWAPALNDRPIERLITERLGMVELRVKRSGAIVWSSFRQRAGDGGE